MMKILNITNNSTYLCTLSHEEMKLITGNKLDFRDLEQMNKLEKEIELIKFNRLCSDYDINSVKNAINSLESAVKFLNNKKESLEHINYIKVS